jgi:RNA polymerase sigma-70 factor (ECF subfamily)
VTREEEAKLIRDINAGDSAAFETLVREHQTRVYNIALKMCADPEEAFDISQEVFLKAYRTIARFRGECSLGTWLYRMTANQCIDQLRRDKRRQRDKLVYLDDVGEDERPMELPDLRWEPQSQLEREELRRSVRENLQRLPQEQRLILTLRDVNGLSYEEIGEILELELGTVKSRIFRARERLAKLLIESGTFPSAHASKRQKKGKRG